MSKLEVIGTFTISNSNGIVYEKKNLFVDKGFEVIARLFGGKFDEVSVGFMQIGTGGDLDNTGFDTGLQNAPDEADTEIRQIIFEKAVLSVTNPTPTRVRYETFLNTFESNSNLINEFALVTLDRTMISHVVTDPDPGLGGRAERFEKSPGAFITLAWELQFDPCP